MDIPSLMRRLQKATYDNAPELLTAFGITGTITTAYLASKATLRADSIIKAEVIKKGDRPERVDILKLVWKEYIPTALVGSATVTAIFYANRVSSKRMAAMGVAYSLSERAFKEYKNKVVERIGEAKNQEIHDEIAEERQQRAEHPETGPVIISNNGTVMCYDHFTGRYFMSDMETIRTAENDIGFQILHDGYASLSDFYMKLEIPTTDFSGLVGWNSDDPLKLIYSTVLSDDNRPCISIMFDPHPEPDFDKFGFM